MWAHIVAALLGICLMAGPSIFGYGGVAADVDHTLGPLAVSIALMAASQILRALRWANVVIGGVLAASALLLARPSDATIAVIGIAVALAATGLVRGRISERFAGGWSALIDERASDSR